MGRDTTNDQLWHWIHSERRRLLSLLESLSAAQWSAASLCAGWSVTEVAAHVASSAGSRPIDVVRAMMRGHGNFNRAIYLEGRRLGARGPAAVLAELRRFDGSLSHPLFTTRWDPLVDVLVHGQDIALPLGLDLPMPPQAAAAAAGHVWSTPFPFRARHRLRGLRLAATDADWSAGSGAAVHGPISALLLLMTGRTAQLAQLEGEGAADLFRRQQPSRQQHWRKS
ncbi:maleylpyruvate isomerase family mycothiol-dependent enzyme [Arthrobacter sp. Sa2CUA1]|uniref:Maleylpyruvate isomerase family mycothiol-dependent enzyme n=1 Tax=Arthrobacter gallicola TaxID=2762225 RepID=A0ABR8UTH9_9MICC|nr:maleylpyruvate isomerase family mycothiol-dependent enzyme [Arthrobacter gallicola]MBD7995834.1 maleylpyruvate isomerase family mycothiol-dependent enzyme [Arthrobacter gallicola]